MSLPPPQNAPYEDVAALLHAGDELEAASRAVDAALERTPLPGDIQEALKRVRIHPNR
jgi:hypothetical protein